VVEHEQRHRDREDSVAEGGDAVDALSGNAVVQGVHPRGVLAGAFPVAEKSKIFPHRGSQRKAAEVAESILATCDLELRLGAGCIAAC